MTFFIGGRRHRRHLCFAWSVQYATMQAHFFFPFPFFTETKKQAMRVPVLLFLGLAAAANALEQSALTNTFVVSSPFQLVLQPTLFELNLEAQTIAAQSISDILSSSIGNLFHDINVVIQDSTYQGGRRRRRRRLQSGLPFTTLTFTVFGSFSTSSGGTTRDYLNSLIQNVFIHQSKTLELIRDLQTKHSFYKDLNYIQVIPVSTTDNKSSEQHAAGFFQSLSYVDICLVVVSICVLLGVAYVFIQSHRRSRQEHERILQLLTRHAAATTSLQNALQDDAGSISSRFQFNMSTIFDKKQVNVHANLDTTPKVTEDEEADDEEPEQVPSKQEENEVYSQVSSDSLAEHGSNSSSSSYHSAPLLESSHELAASSGSGSSIRSERRLSEYHVISTPHSEEDLSLQSSSSCNHLDERSSSNHSDGYSSGMSSAHFSSSRWFQPNGILAPSEDTFDVFQVDVDKFEDSSLLLDDASKASRSSSFLQEWVKSIQVVSTEKSCVAIPDSTPVPLECVSVHSDSRDETTIKEIGDCQSVTHRMAPDDKSETPANASGPVEV